VGRGGEAVILDTHAWIFYAAGRALEKRALRQIERARGEGRLHIAAVTLWEVALLAQERKLRLSQPTHEWLHNALKRTEVHVAPLDVGNAIEGARLHRALRDPADCQIVGTAVQMGVPMATRDARILGRADDLGLDVVEI
jgi:PIN domain nuclease of toxin-antitoxin system